MGRTVMLSVETKRPADFGGGLLLHHRLHDARLFPGRQVKRDYALGFLLRLQLAFDLVRDLGRRGRPELLHLTELLTVLMNSGA